LDTPEPHEWTPEELARRRKRSIALAIVLAVFAFLLFVTTLVRLSGNMPGQGG
jgi:hypothetical protein